MVRYMILFPVEKPGLIYLPHPLSAGLNLISKRRSPLCSCSFKDDPKTMLIVNESYYSLFEEHQVYKRTRPFFVFYISQPRIQGYNALYCRFDTTRVIKSIRTTDFYAKASKRVYRFIGLSFFNFPFPIIEFFRNSGLTYRLYNGRGFKEHGSCL